MKRLNKKHDLINIQILDQSEIEMPNIGLIKVHDSETKQPIWIDTSAINCFKKIQETSSKKINILNSFCLRNNIDLIRVNINDGYIAPLINFFNTRLHRK